MTSAGTNKYERLFESYSRCNGYYRCFTVVVTSAVSELIICFHLLLYQLSGLQNCAWVPTGFLCTGMQTQGQCHSLVSRGTNLLFMSAVSKKIVNSNSLISQQIRPKYVYSIHFSMTQIFLAVIAIHWLKNVPTSVILAAVLSVNTVSSLSLRSFCTNLN